MVRLRQIILNQEVIDTQLLPLLTLGLFVDVDSGQNASVLVEIPCLNLDHFTVEHVCDYLLDLLAEFFHVPLARLRGVDAVQAEGESSEGVVQVDDGLDGVPVNHLHHLG